MRENNSPEVAVAHLDATDGFLLQSNLMELRVGRSRSNVISVG